MMAPSRAALPRDACIEPLTGPVRQFRVLPGTKKKRLAQTGSQSNLRVPDMGCIGPLGGYVGPLGGYCEPYGGYFGPLGGYLGPLGAYLGPL